MLQLVSRHVIEIGFKTFGTETRYGAPESGWPSCWECYYMLGTTTKLSMPFPSSGVVVTLEIFFLGLGLTVTEITIKKVQKQDLKKTLKNKM